MRKVSLERYYFVLYDGALTLKMSKMALNPFCDKTLHIHKHFISQYFDVASTQRYKINSYNIITNSKSIQIFVCYPSIAIEIYFL